MYNTNQIDGHGRWSVLSETHTSDVAALVERGDITTRAAASDGKGKMREGGGEDSLFPGDLTSVNWNGDDNATSSNNEDEGGDEEIPVLFPTKLFNMLEDAENELFASVVSWGASGDTFRVHKKTEFEKVVLPKYFRMTKYKSFTRQLHNYCFYWVNRGPERGGYYNPNFTRRIDPSKCHLLAKKPRKSYRRKQARQGPRPLRQHDVDGIVAVQERGEGFQDSVAAPSNVLLQPPTSHNSQNFSMLPMQSLEPRTIEEMICAPQMLTPPSTYQTRCNSHHPR